jgi:hypothetical protein
MTEEQSPKPSRDAPSVGRRVWRFLAENKRWWLLPMLVVFLLFGLFVLWDYFGNTNSGDNPIFVYD